MAAGDLSASQRRYHGIIVSATGLDATVVTAWIGAESGWGTTKVGHNYLNVGPGKTYPSVIDAAQAAASLVNRSANYAGIREAIASRDPAKQVRAIASSPWDAGRYGGDGSRLIRVYEQLAGSGPIDRLGDAAGAAVAGAAGVAGTVGDALGWLTNPGGKAAEEFGPVIIRAGLYLAFVSAALVLVVIGLLRMTRADNDLAGAVKSIGTLVATRGAAA